MKRILFTAMALSGGLSYTSLAGEVEETSSSITGSSEDQSSWLSELLDASYRLDVQGETLRSSDIDIDQYTVQFELVQPSWNLSVTAGYTEYGIDYQANIVGVDTYLSEQTRQRQAQLGFKINSQWSLDFSARVYDGFSGYRSIWIAERFRQEFDFSPIYQAPDPGGYSYSAGAVYSYASGHSVRLSLGYGRDTIAPGYSIGVGGVERSRENLYRRSATLRFQDVWTPWLKTETQLSVADATLRDKRWSAKSAAHIALGENWTLRLNAGYSEEAPEFDATYGGVALEWNFTGNWHLSAGVDIYSDSGEIPNAGLITTSAPGVETIQYGIGLRWVGESSAFRIYAALYENDYEELDINNQFLKSLYRDRDWTLIQLSYTYQF